MTKLAHYSRFPLGNPRYLLPASRHVVQQGECLASIAARYGLRSAAELRDHSDNHELCQTRVNLHILMPGDIVAIPERPSQPLNIRTGQVNQFTAAPERVTVQLRLKAADGTPWSGCRYELRVGTTVYTGATGSDGAIEHPVVAAHTSGTLDIWLNGDGAPPTRTTLAIGGLDPHDTDSGVHGRLTALGYRCDPGASEASSLNRQAIAAFQEHQGLTVTGMLDEATRARVREIFGF